MPASRTRRYLRFVVGAERQNPRTLKGLLRDERTDRVHTHLLEHEIDLWDELLDWFNEHLTVPPYSDPDRDDLGRRAVCWLRDDARECIHHMRVLAYLLREAGVPTRVLRATDPGRIIWEDEQQVVAAPWRRPRN